MFRTGRNGEWRFGLALGHKFSVRAEVAAEVFATTSSRLADAVSIWNLGARWKAADHASLLFAAGSGLSRTSNEPRARFQGYVGLQLPF